HYECVTPHNLCGEVLVFHHINSEGYDISNCRLGFTSFNPTPEFVFFVTSGDVAVLRLYNQSEFMKRNYEPFYQKSINLYFKPDKAIGTSWFSL
ncbi:MAG: hypothetical protein SWZ49_19350, partial [Cyanobacteriota bacterium]|nr:hypothetical protein [Cyanobacteriota bacterium]